MKGLIKGLLGQQFINNFYHLPMAVIANIYYGFPANKLKVIGVTGTDGKTTTVNMIYQVLKEVGKKVSMVSTVGAVVGGKSFDTGFHVTSPSSFTIQKFARMSKEAGDEYLILEVTSHALDQYRFWGIKFDIGVITNITHEHLDYHKTFENYLQTKLKLIKGAETAIVNKEIKGIKRKVITFDVNKGDFNQKEVKLKLKIPGDYNIENGLAALAVAFVLKINKTIAQRALENFTGVKGRMEEVKNNKGFKVFIDFAHTPNALENVLKALKREARGRLIAVFGSAGKRDTGKRSLMGEVAGRLADISVVTAEDPRGQLALINSQIREGAKKAGAKEGVNFFIIEDRKKAIEFAVTNAKKGDIVGVFGKGHEGSINLDGKREIPWSDREVIESVLSVSPENQRI